MTFISQLIVSLLPIRIRHLAMHRPTEYSNILSQCSDFRMTRNNVKYVAEGKKLPAYLIRSAHLEWDIKSVLSFRHTWTLTYLRRFKRLSLWRRKINQQNAQINSGLIYYWSITPAFHSYHIATRTHIHNNILTDQYNGFVTLKDFELPDDGFDWGAETCWSDWSVIN